MRTLARAATLSALTCLVLAADASAQVGRRIGRSSEIAIPVEVPPAPPNVSGPEDLQAGAVVKCAVETQADPAPPKEEQRSSSADGAQDETVYKGSEVDTKAVIASVPEPAYTPEARRVGTSGRVALRLTLHAAGKVSEVKVLRGLPDGLTNNAVDAACRVEFTPARNDGRAVSQYVTVEFNFEADEFADDSHLPPPRGRRLPTRTRVPLPLPRSPRFP